MASFRIGAYLKFDLFLIKSDISLIFANSLHNGRPILLTADVPAWRCKQSTDTMRLQVLSTQCSIIGDRAFPVAAARAWKSLPPAMRVANSLLHFRWETGKKTATVKEMSDERQNQLILSADKITRQKSVVCHAKIARFCQDRACSIFDDFVGRLFVYRTTNFVYVAMVIVYNGRWIFILVIYCVCYYFRSLDAAKKVMQVLFCDLHSAVVLADNV